MYYVFLSVCLPSVLLSCLLIHGDGRTSMSGRRKRLARHTAAASRVGPESPSDALAIEASVPTREAWPSVCGSVQVQQEGMI